MLISFQITKILDFIFTFIYVCVSVCVFVCIHMSALPRKKPEDDLGFLVARVTQGVYELGGAATKLSTSARRYNVYARN